MTDNFQTGAGVSLFIEPPSHHFLGDGLFETNAAPFGGDQLMAPYTHLRAVLNARGVAVHTADALPPEREGGQKIYVSIGNDSRYESLTKRPDVTLSAVFTMECPAFDPGFYRRLARMSRCFRRTYSWSDAESLEPYVGERLKLERFFWPQSFDRVHESLWTRTDRRLLAIMNGNKLPAFNLATLHIERLRAIEYFNRTGEIDLYGREWDQPPYRVGGRQIPYTVRRIERQARALWQRVHPDPLLAAARKAWRGPAVSKSQTMSGYRFAICFENMALKGWITEKLFDCLFVGTVPIYLGAPEIQEYVWPECYVDMRKFGSFHELREYIVAMPDNEWNAYRDAARDYLASADFRRFRKEAFADIFLKIIDEDAGRTS